MIPPPTRKFSELPVKTTLASTDCLVGFTSPTVGGERKWPVSTVETFVKSFIQTQPFAASAWVSFKGTDVAVNGNATVYGSYNVSSVTRIANFVDTGTGTEGNGFRYQINFAPGTMRNVNYAVLGGSQVGFLDPNGDDQIIGAFGRAGNTVNNCIIGAMDIQARNGNTETSNFISVVFLGGQ